MASEKLSTLIGALSAKSPPVDADKVPILDSANGGNFIYSTWAVFKSTLKTYFDGLYSAGSHAHGNITTAGAIGSTTNLPVITTTSGVLTAGSFGTSSTTFCVGNDARLSDARTPSSHVHGSISNAGAIGTTTDLPIITTTSGVLTAGAFGTGATNFCAGNDVRLSDARTPASHVHGNITNAGAIGSTANLPLITTSSGVITVGAFGTGATDFCAGNDARLATIGKQVIYVPAGAIIPSATGGCDSIAVIATSANHPDLTVLDFDATTAEYAQFSIGMPNQWDEGTVTYQVYWTVTAAVTTGVAWQLQAVAVSNDDTIDAAYGTAVTVTDTALNASNDQHITAVSTAVTIAGTPAAGDIVYFRINRNPADAGDDMTQDARLIGVKVFWTQAVGVEA